jgi:hypothetical protein
MVAIGARFRVGSAVLQVTQPRMPCFKLGIGFGVPSTVKRSEWLAILAINIPGDTFSGCPFYVLESTANRYRVVESRLKWSSRGLTNSILGASRRRSPKPS